MVLISCPECNKQISSSVKTCPHCGKKLVSGWKRFKQVLLLLIVIFLLLLGVSGWDILMAELQINDKFFPSDEKQFVELIKSYKYQSIKATNDVQEKAVQQQTAGYIKSFLYRNIQNWRGTIYSIKQKQDGVFVYIKIYPTTYFADIVPNGDYLISKIGNLKEGDKVTFSGSPTYMDEQIMVSSERILISLELRDIKKGYITPLLDRDWWNSATLNDLKALLDKGVDVNTKDSDGENALHYAVSSNNPQILEIVKELIKRGVSINTKNKDGDTAFDKASFNDDSHKIIDVMEELVSNGAKGSLSRFYSGGRFDTPRILNIVEKLIKNGSDANTGWYLMCTPWNSQTKDIIKIMVKSGADINYRQSDYCSRIGECENPLETSIQDFENYNSSFVDFLLDNGADIHGKNHPLGRTALMYAANGGHLDIVTKLIKRGADVNAKDKEGKTVLMYALGNSSAKLKIIETLIKNGADVDARNIYGENALMVAEHYKYPQQVINVLKKYGATYSSKDMLYGNNLFKNVKSKEFQAVLQGEIEKFLIKYMIESGNTPYNGNLSEYLFPLEFGEGYVPLPETPVLFKGDNVEFFYKQYEITAGYIGEIRFSIPKSKLKPFLNNQ